MKSKNITIYDVARECNLSVATVSRVINNNGKVKESNKKKVLSKIKELNYQPNSLAISLYKKDTSTIGVILPDITSPFFSRIFIEIEKRAIEEGLVTFLCNSMNNYKNEELYLKTLSQKQVKAIVLIGGIINKTTSNKKNRELIEGIIKHTPIIMVNGYVEGIDCSIVSTDERSGIFALVDHLYESGHTKIGVVGGIRGISSTDLKIEYFKEALKEKNLKYNKSWTIPCGFSVNEGKLGMEKLLENNKRPTAVICINDLIALGAITYCQDNNINVPNDISIAGFDDTYMCELINPKLTTVNQNYEEMGNAIMDIIKDNNFIKCDYHKKIDVKLVKRNSIKQIK
ncbi:LacI family DNA-binding transcriptional regulator [Clostridium sp. MB05]